MSGQEELERYEQTEARDLIRLLEMSRPPGELRAPPDFRFKVLSKIEKKPSCRGMFSWLHVAFVPTWAPALTAALLVLSLGVNVWLSTHVLGTSKPSVDRVATEMWTPREPMQAYVFQQGIRPDADLGALVAAQETEPVLKSYGFSDKTSGAKPFLLGTLYAEALAFVRSGDIEAATQRWQEMDRALGQRAEPLLSYRHEMQRSLQQTPPALARFQTWLPLFESFYEYDVNAARRHDQTLPLFQAGAWMTNMRLAATAGDAEGLRRGRVVDYFLSRLDVPKGVEDRLERLGDLLAKKTLSEREIKTVDKLLKKMQQILG
jgi:hypothetical protein